MQEVFFTILVIWILFKILGGTSSSRTFTFNTTYQYPKNDSAKKEGEVKIDSSTAPKTGPKKHTFNKDAGEYVDYEEIK